MKILIIGGDKRYVEMLDILAEQKIEVFLAGYDQLQINHPSIQHVDLKTVNYSPIDAILLPVSGTDSEGYVEATYSTQQLRLTEGMLRSTPSHCVVYPGISNPYLQEISTKAKRKIVPIFSRNDIAIYNSIPTAEATLKLAIEHTDITIHQSKVLILGFGRIGITIARLFTNVGAKVTVAARKEEHFARLFEMGINSVPITSIHRAMEDTDICINTIPKLLLDKTVISNMKKSTLILDLASKPGGTDFQLAKQQGITAIHALGLPGKTAPKTAGKIISHVLIQLLSNQAK